MVRRMMGKLDMPVLPLLSLEALVSTMAGFQSGMNMLVSRQLTPNLAPDLPREQAATVGGYSQHPQRTQSSFRGVSGQILEAEGAGSSQQSPWRRGR